MAATKAIRRGRACALLALAALPAADCRPGHALIDHRMPDASSRICWTGGFSKEKCCMGDASTTPECWKDHLSFSECCPNSDCWEGSPFSAEDCCDTSQPFLEMMCCCVGEESATGNIVVVQEASAPKAVSRSDDVEGEDEKADELEAEAADRRRKEAEEKRKADEEAAAAAAEAQRKAVAEDEVRKKKEDEESALRDAAVQEAVPEAPAVVDNGLSITFREPGGEKYTVNFKTKPLGMDFNKNAKPVTVLKVFCTAKALAVKEGSEVLNIGGTDVEQKEFGQMLEVLKERIEPLQPDGLVIVFRDQSGKQKTVVFPTKPLGMDFQANKKPIRVLKVQGAAQNFGVQAEWEIMRIAGTDVEQMEFAQMLELLKAKIGSLPQKD